MKRFPWILREKINGFEIQGTPHVFVVFKRKKQKKKFKALHPTKK